MAPALLRDREHGDHRAGGRSKRIDCGNFIGRPAVGSSVKARSSQMSQRAIARLRTVQVRPTGYSALVGQRRARLRCVRHVGSWMSRPPCGWHGVERSVRGCLGRVLSVPSQFSLGQIARGGPYFRNGTSGLVAGDPGSQSRRRPAVSQRRRPLRRSGTPTGTATTRCTPAL